jgi:hypothetical protein
MIPGVRRATAILALLFLGSSPAWARPVHKQALADYFGPFLAKKLNDCRTCHLPVAKGKKGDTLEERPHNAFGERLDDVKYELRKAGKKFDIPARLEAVADEDSDGDGVSNLLELLSGHFPGDPKDKPTAAEVAAARKKLAAFRSYRRAAAWDAFAPLRRPAVPKVKNAGWVRNPLDAFLAAEHERRGLKPRPPAARHVLLRRMYLDLTGLPPTRAELRAFLADRSPDAYEKVVDRLLASPRYGERWGRHWMDVWRYSDWAGFGAEVRDSQKHIWHWRDWIIESLNHDKGYDRMIREMLAGDELAPTDPDTLRATGFLARNWFRFNRQVWLENTVEHTAKAFLGVTLNCARCHDHFFDPIRQKEFYAFRAFFEPYNVRTDRVPGQLNIERDGIPRVYDANLSAPTCLFVRGQENNPDKSKSLVPAVPAALGGDKLTIRPVKLPALAYAPDKRAFVIRDLRAASAQSVTLAKTNWDAARRLAEAQKQNPAVQEQARLAESAWRMAAAKHAALIAVLAAEQLEDDGTVKKNPAAWKQAATAAASAQRTHALLEAKHNHLLRQQAVARAQLAADQAAKTAAQRKDANTQVAAKRTTAVLAEVKSQLALAAKGLAQTEQSARLPPTTAYVRRAIPTYPAVSSGRRLALANWIASKKNPLTARVAVNHLWLRHFGKPLVPTVFDFGRNGRKPSHPALLDWLASEFLRQNWSMKQMHRLLVTSSAYRMDSTGDKANAAIDPDNRLVWRMNSRRLEAELVRDSVLSVAGRLDGKMGGPDIDHRLGLVSRRRSVYFQSAAEKQMEFLSVFDAANVTECYMRSESIVPQQALALANSSLVLANARLLAGKLSREVGPKPASAAAFIRAGFESILGRFPTKEEQAVCAQFLRRQAALLADKKKLTAFNAGPACGVPAAVDPHLRARENLVHVLLNHNEFVTIR